MKHEQQDAKNTFQRSFLEQVQQIKTQFDIHATAQQLDVKSSYLTNDKANISKAFEHKKCTTPRTFSQKLYQSHALEIAEEFDQALESQSLERIKALLDKVLEENTNG